MIAKLVAHGHDRAEALGRLEQGLAATVALGVRTNQAFLGACLRHSIFAAGAATTSFIGRHQDELLSAEAHPLLEVVAIAAAILHAGHDEPLAHVFTVPLRLALGSSVYPAALTHRRDGGCTCEIGGLTFDLQLLPSDARNLRVRCDGVTRDVVHFRDDQVLHLHHAGRAWTILDLTYAGVPRSTAIDTDGRLRASMNGRVVAVAASIGDTVEAGQAILTLEAMKMEHVHVAPIAGRITLLAVVTGDQVAADRVVAQIEPESSTPVQEAAP
jgi:geranyl-CoA carboxylase alpha subunit